MQCVKKKERSPEMSSIEKQVKVLGSRIHLPSMNEIIDQMESWISSGPAECRQLVVTGFHGIWEAHKDSQFKSILNAADLWVPDGIAPIAIARWKGIRGIERTPGGDIMVAFFERANEKGYRSFFYGDTDKTLAELTGALERKYPGHEVVGTYSPPFRPLTAEEDDEIVKMINDAEPDILWVGLGMPKQDRWVYEHKDRLNVPIATGVGAAFAFHAGTVERVPSWIGNIGLEWAWRFIKEPRKLWRRDMVDGPQFLWHVMLEATGLRKYN